MKREELAKKLTELGIAEEAQKGIIDYVMAVNGADIEAHKGKVGELQTSVDNLTTQLGEANKTIEGFKGLKVDEIEARAKKWEEDFKAAEKAHGEAISKMKFDSALEKALTGQHKAKDHLSVLPHLKLDQVKLDGDKFTGLDEQVKALREAKGFLFEPETEEPELNVVNTTKSGKTVSEDRVTAILRQGAGLKPTNDKEGK